MNKTDIRILDLHAHLQSMVDRDMMQRELKLRKEAGIVTCFSAGTPGEWQVLKELRERQNQKILGSFGIHPWYADQFEVADCWTFFAECDVIGEIGMDNVWCQVPEQIQKRRLEEQLQVAVDLKKPVILHTKGQEALIAEMLKGFSQPVCVHWFSGDRKTLEQFREQGCYFTIGPDVALVGQNGQQNAGKCRDASMRDKQEMYQSLVRDTPLERLFVETDGIGAVAWARGEKQSPITEIPKALEASICYVAKEKRLTPEQVKEQMWKNLQEFAGKQVIKALEKQ